MREFKQPRRRRQQERDKFAYLTMKNNTFARFARAYLAVVLVLSTTWNDQFCIFVDDVSTWWQMLNYVFLPLKPNYFESLRNDCINAKLYFQMTYMVDVVFA